MRLCCPVCLSYIDDVLEQEDAEEDPLEIVISCPHCKVKLELDFVGGFLETRYFLKEKIKYESIKSNGGRTIIEMVL